MRDLLDPDGAR